MSHFRQELPAEGLAGVKIELAKGNLTVRAADEGAAGLLESTEELEAVTEGDTLRIRQPNGLARLIGERLLGEQQVRVAVEGNVLLDKQLRFEGVIVEIVLPTSVREVICSTSRGEIQIEGVDARVDARSGRGDLLLRGGQDRSGAEIDGCHGGRWNRQPSRLATGKGNIQVEQHQGDLEAYSGSGEIRIADAGGQLFASTGRGNVVVSGLSGRPSLKTGRGDIVATDLQGAQLSATTGHGEIILGGRLAGAKLDTGHGEIACRIDAAEGEFDLQTGSGDITLDLLEGVEARVDATTHHGRVESDLPLVRVGTSGPTGRFSQRLVGTVGGSQPRAKLLLHTHRGNIQIGRPAGRTEGSATVSQVRGEGPAAIYPGPTELQSPGVALLNPPEPAGADHADSPNVEESPTEIDESAERHLSLEAEILESVSQGELSVDEALVLLERIPGRSGAPRGENS